MDENWTCLGEVRNQCASNLLSVRPLAAAVLASGWVKRCAPEALQPSAFVVVSLEKTFNLLCSLSEACLVAASLDAGYDVWVTGVLLITRRTSIINFEGCSVWRTSANAPLVIPAMIAKSLWHSARATAIDQAFSVRPIEDIEQRTLHPLAYESLPVYITLAKGSATDSTEISGAMWASDSEARVRTRMSGLTVSALHQVGNTQTVFNPRTGATHAQQEPSETRGETQTAQAKGCVLVGEDCELLLRILAIITAADETLEWQSPTANGSTLIVSPRNALPLVATVFRTKCPNLEVCLTSDQFREAEFFAPALVTADLLKTAEATVTSRTYDRVIYVDWPKCLVGFSGVVKSEMSYGLCSGAHGFNHVNSASKETAVLFGVEGTEHWGASELKKLFSRRILRIACDKGRMELHKYSSRLAPALTDREAQIVKVGSSVRRARLGLYAEIMPKNAKTGTVHGEADIEAFFRKRMVSYSPSAFATKAFAAPSGDCPVCYEPDPDCVTSCGHFFCHTCVSNIKGKTAACPLCKEPVTTSNVVRVETLTDKTRMETGFIDFLSESLRGYRHEKLAASLRARGVEAAAWRGNAKQLYKNAVAFERGRYTVMIVDPSSIDMKWVSLPRVDRLVVVLPLDTSKAEICCQVKDTLNSIQQSLDFSILVVKRQGEEMSLPERPLCEDHYGTLKCPFLVHF
jgi:hypothetical protein